MSDREDGDENIGADVHLPRAPKRVQRIGEYKLVRQLAVRGYDEEWLVQSVTGAYLLAEIVRRSKFETIKPYDRAFAALKLYEPISHLHQNLEPILHAGVSGTGDYFYYVTDLADDLSLSPKFRPSKYRPTTLESIVAHNGMLPIGDCITVGLDIVAALGYLHERGLVHRNVKPLRIHFSRKIPKLSGVWLVAKRESPDRAGTPGFSPPEGHGLPGGDLYSLGKTLERIAPNSETAFSNKTRFQQRWQSFLGKLCHPDPAFRYSSTTVVARDLSELRDYLEPGSESHFYSCFISYAHQDRAFALKLFEALRGRGVQCWLDEYQLLPGDDLHDGIDQGIRLWDKVLLCASQSSLTSWWVDGEINRAFQKEAAIMKERGKKVLALIPLNLDGFLFNDEYQSGKKSEIKGRVAANFVGWEKNHALFDRELEKVIRALKTDDAGREKPPLPKL